MILAHAFSFHVYFFMTFRVMLSNPSFENAKISSISISDLLFVVLMGLVDESDFVSYEYFGEYGSVSTCYS